MMISEIAEGNWADAFKVKHMDKYNAPTLEGVDCPNLGVDQAWNDKDNGVLNIGTYVADRSLTGQQTSWRITNLPNASEAVVICDGTTISNVEIIDGKTIRVPTDIGQHQYQIYTGYFGQELAITKPDPMNVANASAVAVTRRTAEQNAKAAESVMAGGSANCPCCTSVS